MSFSSNGGFGGLVNVSVSAHSIFPDLQETYVDGVSAGHLEGIRVHGYDGPITEVHMICNGVINPYHTPISTMIVMFPPARPWHHTLDGANSVDSSDSSHNNPVMATVDSATHTDVIGLAWFMIYEDGYNTSSISFTIPDCIEPGQYLLRHELIVLMDCVQLEITGGGSTSPSTVSFPGLTQVRSDPGIAINIYQTLTGITIPKSEVFSC
ncbi:glycosyl hydrolase family 61-domain-containing protein [Armillaria nabsnona]|nr:glycosyl hydrolase family 61-domain-containing protein [Armillaria nabsnona]